MLIVLGVLLLVVVVCNVGPIMPFIVWNDVVTEREQAKIVAQVKEENERHIQHLLNEEAANNYRIWCYER